MATATVAGKQTEVTSDNWYELANTQIQYQGGSDLDPSIQSAIISAFRTLGTGASTQSNADGSASPILDSYLNTAMEWASDTLASGASVAASISDAVAGPIVNPKNPVNMAYHAIVGGVSDEIQSLGTDLSIATTVAQLIVVGALVYGAFYLYKQVRIAHAG